MDYAEKRSGQYDCAREEKLKIAQLESEGVPTQGLRLLGLSKTYRVSGNKSIKALKNTYLEVNEGELLAILGHNGAGKTTLLNLLTGQLNPSSGNAKICGYDLNTQLNEILQIMGVVPQFDILWNDMTAYDHMRMFCMIKGVKNIDSVIKN